jgi:ribosomal protein L11 methylase PrmA
MAALPARHPEDLTGKSVLDIGCNGGFYAIEMKRRGADRVLGVDFDDRYLEQARFAAEVKGSTSSSASCRSTTSPSSASASTSSCSWACSTTCAIHCWPWT